MGFYVILAEVRAEREMNSPCTSSEGADLVSRLDLFNTFVSRSLMEKLRSAVNRTLSSRKKKLFNAMERKGIIFSMHFALLTHKQQTRLQVLRKRTVFFNGY